MLSPRIMTFWMKSKFRLEKGIFVGPSRYHPMMYLWVEEIAHLESSSFRSQRGRRSRRRKDFLPLRNSNKAKTIRLNNSGGDPSGMIQQEENLLRKGHTYWMKK